MPFRIQYLGDAALAGVAAAVIERMAREVGLHQDEAREFAETTRSACEQAHGGAEVADLATAPRGARVHVRVREGEPAGSVLLEIDALAPRARRRPRRA